MGNNSERFDVVVIGAGLAGLIAGTIAAQGGARTVVVDAHEPGGRARTADRNGFLFNEGPHALYQSGALMRFLKRIGHEPSGGRPSIAETYVAAGTERHLLPSGAVRLARTPLLSVRGRVAAGRLLAKLPRLDQATLAGRSVNHWCDDQDLPDDARALVLMLVRVVTYVDAPDLLDAGAAVAQLQGAVSRGVRYVDGGWQTIVAALTRRLAAAGGRLRTGVRVEAVASDGWSALVRTSAGDLMTRAVVLAGLPPAAAARLLGREPGRWGDLGPPVEATCLALGVSRGPEPPIVFGMDRPVYLSTHAPTARMAPAGRAIVEVMKYLPPSHEGRVESDRAELDELRRSVGIEDGGIIEQRFLRRMTVAHAMPLARCGGLEGRTPVTAPGEGNVFLAGDWVGSEGLLSDAAAASGRRAAKEAFRVLELVGAR